MSQGTPLRIVICHVSPLEEIRAPVVVLKALAASLTRSGSEAILNVLHNLEAPLFRARRKEVVEIPVSLTHSEMRAEDSVEASRKVLLRLPEFIQPASHSWILVMDPAGLALRDIDHLIPPDGEGPFAAPPVDFYWAPRDGSPEEATSGIWAVRGHLLHVVLSHWKKSLSEISPFAKSASKPEKSPLPRFIESTGGRSPTPPSSPSRTGPWRNRENFSSRSTSAPGSATRPA